MKKIIFPLALALALAMTAATCTVFAAKSPGNLAGAQKVAWNLSAEVMPVPPYGSIDIPGSDDASNLVVNQPNGKNEALINASMKGLAPNTEYTVYLSNSYVPNTGWSGMFNAQTPFTFKTNAAGNGNWNIRLASADFPGAGTYGLSVWINNGATLLISDNFQVTVAP